MTSGDDVKGMILNYCNYVKGMILYNNNNNNAFIFPT